jgi:lipopolysaccharide/colanic/teichoic acid biosynthesis glycosyltransferase
VAIFCFPLEVSRMLTNLDALETSPDASAQETANSILSFRRPDPNDSDERSMPLPTRARRIYLPTRRLLDFSVALVLALLALPVVLLAALAVRLSSRGPAFYTQVRTGKNGKPFTIFKIRSMIHNCESLTGPRWTIPGDPRVTPAGWLLRRTHIDELPQLLNVLIGEMSLIGPRPERPEFVNELEEAIPGYEDRHTVLPGITGLAQVQLAPDTDIKSVRRKLRYDLHYVRSMSLGLDLRIMLATGLHMLGMPFDRLQRLRIVPGPSQVESSAAIPSTEESPRVQNQAA